MTERRVGLDHRDPMLRPFIEVEAKIIREVVADAKSAGESARAIAGEVAALVHEDAERAAETMSERLATGRRLPIACSAGCSYCCYSST
ncbi:MAG: hypothetical protein KF894_33920, partial [Labilithrix sp.]|nr:hypothetical protein [Labilithrix sp.]